MKRASGLAGLAVLLAAGANACSGDRCAGREADEVSGAPVIDNFWVLDHQIPGDPWTVLFGVDYTDGDADLEAGVAEFYLNRNDEPAVQEMAEAFRQSGVQPSQTSGSVWMALRFADTIEDGTDVTLGLQIVDAAGHRSNCYTVDLHFDVAPLAQNAHGIARVVAMRHIACGGPSS